MIGLGQIGKYHVGNYQKIPDANIVAVADMNEAEAKRVAAENNIPHVYSDFCELLQHDDIDAVDVCLHNNFHAPVTMAALQAGKHVYCKKPMAGSYRDAERMYQTAQETKQTLCIQLSNIFSKETKAAKALIEAGELGPLYHARSRGFRRRGRPYVDGYVTPPSCKNKIRVAAHFMTWVCITSPPRFICSVTQPLILFHLFLLSFKCYPGPLTLVKG